MNNLNEINTENEVFKYNKSDIEGILNLINMMTFQGINNAKIIAEITNILGNPIKHESTK